MLAIQFNSHMWPVPTVLDDAGLEHFYLCRESYWSLLTRNSAVVPGEKRLHTLTCNWVNEIGKNKPTNKTYTKNNSRLQLCLKVEVIQFTYSSLGYNLGWGFQMSHRHICHRDGSGDSVTHTSWIGSLTCSCICTYQERSQMVWSDLAYWRKAQLRSQVTWVQTSVPAPCFHDPGHIS